MSNSHSSLVSEYLKLKAQIEMLEASLKTIQEDLLTDPTYNGVTDPRIRIQTNTYTTVTIKPELRKLIDPSHYVALSQFRTDKEILPVLEIVTQLLPSDLNPQDYYAVSNNSSTFIVRTRKGEQANAA